MSSSGPRRDEEWWTRKARGFKSREDVLNRRPEEITAEVAVSGWGCGDRTGWGLYWYVVGWEKNTLRAELGGVSFLFWGGGEGVEC